MIDYKTCTSYKPKTATNNILSLFIKKVFEFVAFLTATTAIIVLLGLIGGLNG